MILTWHLFDTEARVHHMASCRQTVDKGRSCSTHQPDLKPDFIRVTLQHVPHQRIDKVVHMVAFERCHLLQL